MQTKRSDQVALPMKVLLDLKAPCAGQVSGLRLPLAQKIGSRLPAPRQTKLHLLRSQVQIPCNLFRSCQVPRAPPGGDMKKLRRVS